MPPAGTMLVLPIARPGYIAMLPGSSQIYYRVHGLGGFRYFKLHLKP